MNIKKETIRRISDKIKTGLVNNNSPDLLRFSAKNIEFSEKKWLQIARQKKMADEFFKNPDLITEYKKNRIAFFSKYSIEPFDITSYEINTIEVLFDEKVKNSISSNNYELFVNLLMEKKLLKDKTSQKAIYEMENHFKKIYEYCILTNNFSGLKNEDGFKGLQEFDDIESMAPASIFINFAIFVNILAVLLVETSVVVHTNVLVAGGDDECNLCVTDECLACEACEDECPVGAISFHYHDGKAMIDQDICTCCEDFAGGLSPECAEVCPVECIQQCSSPYNLSQSVAYNEVIENNPAIYLATLNAKNTFLKDSLNYFLRKHIDNLLEAIKNSNYLNKILVAKNIKFSEIKPILHEKYNQLFSIY